MDIIFKLWSLKYTFTVKYQQYQRHTALPTSSGHGATPVIGNVWVNSSPPVGFSFGVAETNEINPNLRWAPAWMDLSQTWARRWKWVCSPWIHPTWPVYDYWELEADQDFRIKGTFLTVRPACNDGKKLGQFPSTRSNEYIVILSKPGTWLVLLVLLVLLLKSRVLDVIQCMFMCLCLYLARVHFAKTTT